MKINLKDINLEVFKPGISKKLLAKDDSRNFQIDFIRLEPNAKLSQHSHPDVEWVYVIEGSMCDESGEFSKGDFLSILLTHNTPLFQELMVVIFYVVGVAKLKIVNMI